MSTEIRVAEHLGDEELARLLDDELSPDERSSWNSHLEACTECSRRFDELSDASAWLTANLWVLEAGYAPNDMTRARTLSVIRSRSRASVEARGARHSYLRAAAVIAAVMVGALSVQPVRAWITEGVQRLTGGFGSAPVVEAPGAVVDAPGAVVTFRPADSLFLIDLATAQSAGTVTIEAAPDGQATVQIMGGADELLVVLPTGLRVQNDAVSTSSYRVRLPRGVVQRIEVRAGGELIAAEDFASGAGPMSIDLARVTGTE